MKIAREWATPLTIGSFTLIAATGVLMFFHLDTGLNKTVHEWLGWLLLAAVGVHVTSNVFAFRRYLTQRRAQLMIGASIAVLALSFLPLGGASSEPPFVAPAKALAAAPLPLVAQVAGVTTAELRSRLQQAGLAPTGDEGSIATLVGPDGRRQIQVLARVIAPAAATAATRTGG